MTTMLKTALVALKQQAIGSLFPDYQARQGAFRSKVDAQTEEGGDLHPVLQLTTMRVSGGVATIPFRGYVTPDDPFAFYWGETTLRGFQNNLSAAVADEKIHTIVIDFFSPGGSVYGVEAAAAAVREAGKKKKVIGYTDSLAASAAYWVYSACNECYIGSESTEIGGIGVYMAHFDYSEAMDKMGITVTEITSGKFKGLGSPYSPLEKDEKAQLQADSDYLYTRFVTAWSTYRGVPLETALKVSNGLTYFGSAAVENGLADGIKSYQEIVTMNEEEKKQLAEAEAAKATAEAAAAEATERALKAEAAQKELADKVAALEAKQQQDDKEAIANEGREAYKAALGRDATDEEVQEYVASDKAVRTAIKATLAATAAKLATNTGNLTTALANEGKAPEAEVNPIVAAARGMGISK